MLSGPSAQSPISSVLTMPTVSVPAQQHANAASVTNNVFSTDNLLLSAMPGMMAAESASASDFIKPEFAAATGFG